MSAFLEAQPVEVRDRVAALLAAEAVEMAVLLKLDFATDPLYLSNRNVAFTDLKWGHLGGAGAGLLVGLPDFETSEGDLAPFREYALGIPDDWSDGSNWRSALAELITTPMEYRGRDAGLYGQLFEPETGQPAGHPFAFDVGFMDRLTFSLQPGGTVISLTTESLLARKGVPVYGMLTYFDQKRRSDGSDEGLQFTTEAGKLVQWTQW